MAYAGLYLDPTITSSLLVSLPLCMKIRRALISMIVFGKKNMDVFSGRLFLSRLLVVIIFLSSFSFSKLCHLQLSSIYLSRI